LQNGNEFVLPFRGGSFWNYSNAGVFALNLNFTRAFTNLDVGFRAALPHYQGRASTDAARSLGIKEFVSVPTGRKMNYCEGCE
jgi:hypothetical protein